MKVAVSFINSIYPAHETINKISSSNADYLHLDIMDGLFVSQKNYSYMEIKDLIVDNHKPLDIHLMVEEPLNTVKDYATLKPYDITFHLESTKYPMTIINYLKEHHIKVGIAISPDTPIMALKPYLAYVDLILIMSVKPGSGGQKFLPQTILKLTELNSLKPQYSFIISVDGGINETNIKDIPSDMVVSGSFVCKYPDYNAQINKLKSAINLLK